MVGKMFCFCVFVCECLCVLLCYDSVWVLIYIENGDLLYGVVEMVVQFQNFNVYYFY